MKKQTAGRNSLGDIAPKFAELNDDILFGEVWSRVDKLSLRDRSLITVTALISKGVFDNSLKYHIQNAKNNGVTLVEMTEAITHLAFYVGWPNAWAVFPIVREVYSNDVNDPKESLFGLGEYNKNYENYFVGKSYLKMLNLDGVSVANVTFEPGCRNNWHIHETGGQILLCTDGEGLYQEDGQKSVKLFPGSVIYIAPGVKHWHGATNDSWFSHIAIEIPSNNPKTTWLDKVDQKTYDEANNL